MAQLGVLRLTTTDFVVHRDSVDFVTAVINYVAFDWAEHQKHLETDPEHQPFYTDVHRAYVDRIRPMWTSFLQTPMFEVKMEIPGAPRSGVHRSRLRHGSCAGKGMDAATEFRRSRNASKGVSTIAGGAK